MGPSPIDGSRSNPHPASQRQQRRIVDHIAVSPPVKTQSYGAGIRDGTMISRFQGRSSRFRIRVCFISASIIFQHCFRSVGPKILVNLVCGCCEVEVELLFLAERG